MDVRNCAFKIFGQYLNFTFGLRLNSQYSWWICYVATCRFRGPPMPPPRMAFDGHSSDRPPRPQTDRAAIIKDHALKEFDRLEPGDGSWAAAVDSDVDYSTKLVFSDEEDAASGAGKTDSKLVFYYTHTSGYYPASLHSLGNV